MKNYRQPLLTILIIFATAYILTIVGCAPASGGADLAIPTDSSNPTNGANASAPIKPIELSKLRECSGAEFKTLQDWSFALEDANAALQKANAKYDEKIGSTSLVAIKKCDALQSYHTNEPCKRTANLPTGVSVKGYDAFRIKERCAAVDNYLTKFNKRPVLAQPAKPTPSPEPPVMPVNPIPPAPTTPLQGNLPQCTAEEFAVLKTWRTALDIANKNIAAMNSTLVFNQNAINAATTATQQCEKLIVYHQSNSCAREKEYTGQSMRDQCKIARSYYYDFAQRKDSLISTNARLYFDTSVIANKSFRSGFGENSVYGNCMISNETQSAIAYTGQAVLVKEARVYTNNAIEDGRNMFVFKTEEGLKFECYGLEYSSILTSKTEVVRLLSNKQTKIPLRYELN